MSKKRMKGFGLIEILVTLGVLTVGILGVTTLHSVITQQSIQNKTKTEALLIAGISWYRSNCRWSCSFSS